MRSRCDVDVRTAFSGTARRCHTCPTCCWMPLQCRQKSAAPANNFLIGVPLTPRCACLLMPSAVLLVTAGWWKEIGGFVRALIRLPPIRSCRHRLLRKNLFSQRRPPIDRSSHPPATSHSPSRGPKAASPYCPHRNTAKQCIPRPTCPP